jgi:putative inorganic carbon (HCO3(-)) transporter
MLTDRARRATWAVAFAVILTAIVLSLTRAAWIACTLLFAVVAVVRLRSFIRTIAPALVVLAVAIPFLLVLMRVAPTFQSFVTKSASLQYGSNVERLNRWRAGFAMVRDRPVFGVGPGAYEDAYPNYRDAAFVTPQSDERMGAHSDLVRTAAEQGIPGVVVLTFLVLTTFGVAARLARHGQRPEIRRLAAALAAGLFTYTIHGLFNEYWRVTKVAFLMWTFVGLLAALEQIDRRLAAESAEGGLSPEGGPS